MWCEFSRVRFIYLYLQIVQNIARTLRVLAVTVADPTATRLVPALKIQISNAQHNRVGDHVRCATIMAVAQCVRIRRAPSYLGCDSGAVFLTLTQYHAHKVILHCFEDVASRPHRSTCRSGAAAVVRHGWHMTSQWIKEWMMTIYTFVFRQPAGGPNIFASAWSRPYLLPVSFHTIMHANNVFNNKKKTVYSNVVPTCFKLPRTGRPGCLGRVTPLSLISQRNKTKKNKRKFPFQNFALVSF